MQHLGEQPLDSLKGVGPRLKQKLQRLGLDSVLDVLFLIPYRYQDRTRVIPIGSLRAGQSAMAVGQVVATTVRFGRRRSLVTVISDNTGFLVLRLFHFSRQQQMNLGKGRWVRCFGEIRPGRSDVEMIHPEYRVSDERPENPTEDRLTPVYPSVEGVGQRVLRQITDQALANMAPDADEWIPPAILDKYGFPSLYDALGTVHRPPRDVSIDALLEWRDPAQLRLVFEEMLAHHLAVRLKRRKRSKLNAPVIQPPGELWKRLSATLEFELTAAQQRVIAEVREGFGLSHPTLRLLQGDVGSGKTVVAAAAALDAVEAGYQAIVLAPTELLAEQHFRTMKSWMENIDVKVDWLVGKLTRREREAILARLCSGESQIVVGTHALFQEAVDYANIGLIVVDEQHRFGVEQRHAMRQKGSRDDLIPHQLIMTATPIPRSLTMVMYADMDISLLDESPPGRERDRVETVVMPNTRRDEVVARIKDACAAGRRVYWVCPIIDESETLEVEAATARYETLSRDLPDLRIALIHGRTPSDEKASTMTSFRAGGIDLLVATTIIEVGVDVPEASLMIIENSERLGLSQLHQLRGRVGRGEERACCVLMYQAPLGDLAKERLRVMRDSHSGFEIAERDLALRGPGDLMGTRQSGVRQFHIANLARDRALLPDVVRTADALIEAEPSLVAGLVRRWIRAGMDYSHV